MPDTKNRSSEGICDETVDDKIVKKIKRRIINGKSGIPKAVWENRHSNYIRPVTSNSTCVDREVNDLTVKRSSSELCLKSKKIAESMIEPKVSQMSCSTSCETLTEDCDENGISNVELKINDVDRISSIECRLKDIEQKFKILDTVLSSHSEQETIGDNYLETDLELDDDEISNPELTEPIPTLAWNNNSSPLKWQHPYMQYCIPSPFYQRRCFGISSRS